jgi:hypothetical protein
MVAGWAKLEVLLAALLLSENDERFCRIVKSSDCASGCDIIHGDGVLGVGAVGAYELHIDE